ncbi:hypothetical protein OPV22_035117 [Ensete ventricosum]|uniref:adenine phosphoribosyltransferase n=1 Tax=Ensete ventricosum TaxID=4639 RepID=A0AAX5NFD1_ENSVE|nr:hypothetical protein OPV22_035117 [Ensete ventricosum]
MTKVNHIAYFQTIENACDHLCCCRLNDGDASFRALCFGPPSFATFAFRRRRRSRRHFFLEAASHLFPSPPPPPFHLHRRKSHGLRGRRGPPAAADRVRHTRHPRLPQARYHVPGYHDPAARSRGGHLGIRSICSSRGTLTKESLTVVAGIEARGFIFRPPIALVIGYKMEMHVGALQPGDRALVINDLIATGGTLSAIRLLGIKCK